MSVQIVRTVAGGKGAYAAVDCVGGSGTAAVTQSLRERGTLILWGAMAGFTTTMFIPDIIFRFVQVSPHSLTSWSICPALTLTLTLAGTFAVC